MPKRIDEDGLFQTTVAVFAECGYRATTTQEIATRAGVNEATLFRRYGAKANLINTALRHVLADSSFARVAITDDVTADLTALVRSYVETAQQYGGAVATLLADVPRNPELRDAIAALMPNLVNAAGVLAAHQDGGRLAAGDPLQTLVALIAPLLVFGLWARTGATPRVPDIDPAGVVADFLDGHRARV
ncbi:regulatory protein [Mycolicibacterium aromaticivorans JS19b1 = JCM 16368]|uniref:Regulatory protein n=1 Tax=Mycolicibacterium aromaticivorans JS19b1 = JCM 16368 TaxID=1440774 RepID=A0A064CQR5_9MYCO|nr:TetR/AcrR family transcriptional regulator [Mycolicibacterium aromaticivorans]KDF02012.1 regulatory protein [Mycolicibacterium aromaticivorans JS19b1 = JCM 16368]